MLMILMLCTSIAHAASPTTSPIEVHGHRGARARFPENTLPAFQYALDLDVDVLEMDLAVTKDGVLVLSHDPHLNPAICTDSKGQKITSSPLIHSLTLSEVKQYDCGALQNPRFPEQKPVPGTKIPTLDEVIALVAKHPHGKRVKFNIETKIEPEHPEHTVTPEKFAKLLVRTLERHKILDRTYIQSFDYRTLIAARKLKPKAIISALSENPKEDLGATARKLKADVISPYWEMLNAENVKQIRAAGAKIAPWTVNTPEGWAKMVELGVDGIITDDPEGLINWMNKNKKPAL